jgi:predicted amidohydrolase
MVIDPWGEVLAELGGVEDWKGEPQLEVVELDMQKLERVRREMPLKRRADVYPEV